MYTIECVGIMPIMGEPHNIRSVMGNDDGKGFLATFDAPGEDPDELRMLPNDDQKGGWPDQAKYQGEVYYLGDPIKVDELTRSEIQAKFIQALRDAHGN